VRASRSKRKTERITLWRVVTTRDEAGQPVEGDPLRLADGFAAIETVSGGEASRGRQVDATASHLVEIWAVQGLRAGDWVEWEGKRLNILAVLDRSGRRVEQELPCKSDE